MDETQLAAPLARSLSIFSQVRQQQLTTTGSTSEPDDDEDEHDGLL